MPLWKALVSEPIRYVFEDEASAQMKARFGLSLPQYFPDSTTSSVRAVGDALMALLDLLEHHLAELSNHQAHLGAGEREVIAQLQTRQKARHNDHRVHGTNPPK